jgi:hypothetical protein
MAKNDDHGEDTSKDEVYIEKERNFGPVARDSEADKERKFDRRG